MITEEIKAERANRTLTLFLDHCWHEIDKTRVLKGNKPLEGWAWEQDLNGIYGHPDYIVPVCECGVVGLPYHVDSEKLSVVFHQYDMSRSFDNLHLIANNMKKQLGIVVCVEIVGFEIICKNSYCNDIFCGMFENMDDVKQAFGAYLALVIEKAIGELVYDGKERYFK